MDTNSDVVCVNPYCDCDQPCQCQPPCTCNLELVDEEMITEWDADAGFLVHRVIARYAPVAGATTR